MDTTRYPDVHCYLYFVEACAALVRPAHVHVPIIPDQVVMVTYCSVPDPLVLLTCLLIPRDLFRERLSCITGLEMRATMVVREYYPVVPELNIRSIT